jgi:hypothetical protein
VFIRRTAFRGVGFFGAYQLFSFRLNQWTGARFGAAAGGASSLNSDEIREFLACDCETGRIAIDETQVGVLATGATGARASESLSSPARVRRRASHGQRRDPTSFWSYEDSNHRLGRPQQSRRSAPRKAKRIRMTPPQESRAMDVDDELVSLAIVPRKVSPHLDALGEKAKDYARNARAQNTRRAYESDWRQFSSWLRRQGFPMTPPNPQTVGLYLAACADGTGRITAMSVASLERRLSGIAWHYRQLGQPLDTQDRHIATVLAGIRRAHGRPPVQKEAIFADDLLAMLATLDNDLRGLRDRAILAIGFAGGPRRSEIVGLDCGPSQSEDGTGWIEIFGAAKGAGAAKDEGRDASSAENDGSSDVSRAAKEGGLLLTINGKTGWRAPRSDAAPAPSPAPSRCSKPGCGLVESPTGRCFAVSPRKTRASPRSA